ncbi:MAG: CoA transferase [Pseudomonadales bacterium]|jgi:crotonobetainyl-CoA:carnitine CoA-transferase CaiB-like acyl-CoA transferase|nr:CoA transferase [Pseudomonadales bacterium]MDP6472305.1 CoA transferase [Pseudomonadales bacterium]MDP6828101.1 CoA transferase [Pseudomonadales bacterium]MDP6971799.1 CoA transferase [Pseudomonadales bacterium]|tara:strand:+ start:789 stop:1973 length:1185 start_codon:yes stop_codon:yes gene_type:complete
MLAFDGITVLDFTQVLAGPFATLQLANLGAEVIKIEPPGVGDMTRGLMPGDEKGGMSPSFITCNLGKRSLTLDLKADDAAEIVHALVTRADVLVENFKPGVMDRLGFGFQALAEINPLLIYCSISGYGQGGPKARLAAFDGAIQASSGMMAISGHPETGPTRSGYFAVDMPTALNAAFSISAALLRRQNTGVGQRLDVAMLDTAMLMIAPQMGAYLIDGTEPELQGNRSPTRQPTADVFPVADGYLQIVALREAHIESLFDIVGLASEYTHYDTPALRLEHRDKVRDLLRAALGRRSKAAWLDPLLEANVPVSEVRTLAEVAEEEQFGYRDTLATLSTPGKGNHRIVFAGHHAAPDGPRFPGRAPLLGEHSKAILAEMGCDEERIAELVDRGVV